MMMAREKFLRLRWHAHMPLSVYLHFCTRSYPYHLMKTVPSKQEPGATVFHHWKRWDNLQYLQVEDFVECSQNSAQTVREKEFDVIHECFHDTFLQLKSLTSHVSQMTELKNSLFMSKFPKPHSEPLLQPMEKHAKLRNGWVNGPLSSDPVKEFTFKVKETNGRLHCGGAQQGHYLYVNYNVTTHNHLPLQNNFIICRKSQY